MFYVKSKINEESEIHIDITDENVFTRCPGCGAEIPVDIVEGIRNEDLDLFGTAIYCHECTVIRRTIKNAPC